MVLNQIELKNYSNDEILNLYYSTKYDYINNRTSNEEDLKNEEICVNYRNVAMEINRRLFNAESNNLNNKI